MSGWVPTRLRALIGQDLDEVNLDGLRNVIGLTEDVDLEFKAELYGTSDAQTKEASYDVVALANAGGGLLVIGMSEDGSGIATELSPVDPNDRDFGTWIHQVLASRSSPLVIVTHRAVPVDQGVVHLVGIAPSIHAPHGVSVGDGAIRYPIRAGTTRRWLSQVEVADLYRRRFAALSDRGDILEQIHSSAVEAIPEDEEPDLWAWLVICLVPDFPGSLRFRRGLVGEWQTWINALLEDFPAYGRSEVNTTLGFQCLQIYDVADPNDPIRNIGGRLDVDGGGYLLFGYAGGRNMIGVGEEVVPIYDEHLLGDVVNGLGVLATHAARSGAAGDAQVSAQLISRIRPMVLAEYRSNFPGQLRDTRSVAQSTGVTRRTVLLADSTTRGVDLLGAAQMLVADLGSAFGQAEPQQVSTDLQLVLNRFQREWQARLRRWAEAGDVQIV